jgi:hypothetical protein
VRLGFASLNEKEMDEAVGLLKKAVAGAGTDGGARGTGRAGAAGTGEAAGK